MAERIARKVVLVTWDAADWRAIHPLMDSGEMPALRRLVENGVHGDLASLEPQIAPLLWTSIATGLPPDRHRVLGFQEPDPVSGGLRAAASTSRQGKAVWNILSQAGLRPIVLNGYASHPAERMEGVFVSETFPAVRGPAGGPWPLTAGCIHPERLRDRLAELRLHPGELTGDDLLPFLPRLAEIDQDQDPRPRQLAVALAQTITVHGAATCLMENEPWDFLSVTYRTLDQLGTAFLPFSAPRMEGVPEREFAIYHDLIPSVYRFHDMMLARLMALAGPDAVFVVLSGHGTKTGELRPPSGSGAWKRAHGIFCASGPGIRRDELVFGAGLLDIAPFLLTLFGLPPGADMPGRVLPDAFDKPPSLERIPTWEDAPAPAAEEWDCSDALDELARLGYGATVAASHAQSLEQLYGYEDTVLARSFLSAGRHADAIPLLERAVARRPDVLPRLVLANCYFQDGRFAEARRLAEAVLAEDPAHPHAAATLAHVEIQGRRHREAAALLDRAERSPSLDTWVLCRIGNGWNALREWHRAEQAFLRALAIDPGLTGAHSGRAEALLGAGKRQEAAEAALDAIGLRYENAAAHLVLGIALAGMDGADRIERAIHALETSIRFRPTAAARQWLAAIRRKSSIALATKA